jgi:hypothetical protein
MNIKITKERIFFKFFRFTKFQNSDLHFLLEVGVGGDIKTRDNNYDDE